MNLDALQNLFANPYGNGLKRLMGEIMQDKYPHHEVAIDRLAAGVRDAREYEQVGKLIAAVYEAGFLRAVDQHKEVLERYGLKVNITS